MQSEYFEGKVELLREEKEEIKVQKVVKRLSWFRKEVVFEPQTKTKHFAICSLLGTKFMLKIPVDKEYTLLNIGDKVSVHLKFEFEFACFHYPGQEDEPRTIEVKKKYDI